MTQKHGAGCAVACVAYILNTTYDKALTLFKKPEQAISRGYFCREIVIALQKGKKDYSYKKAISSNVPPYSIVFIERSKKYPLGHYLLKTEDGSWMNPWINFPCIASAESGFQKRLPGKAQWIISPLK